MGRALRVQHLLGGVLAGDPGAFGVQESQFSLRSAFTGPGLLTRVTLPEPPQLAYPRGIGSLWEPRPITGTDGIAAVLGRSRTLLLYARTSVAESVLAATLPRADFAPPTARSSPCPNSHPNNQDGHRP
ncbi:hypothetical protein ACFWDI_38750 [Streptomyces sp. NPDC060064]|uniref:hypothetical protein n=1 Tax=Streptomyces sp. NPDC060064 TaxID=3347049 RepID=UPI0036B35A60